MIQNGQTEQKQGYDLIFGYPNAYKGTSSGEVCL